MFTRENVIVATVTYKNCSFQCKALDSSAFVEIIGVYMRNITLNGRFEIQNFSRISACQCLLHRWVFYCKIRARHSFVFPAFSSSFILFSKHSYLCNKKKITRWLEHTKFIFDWNKDFTSERNSLFINLFSISNQHLMGLIPVWSFIILRILKLFFYSSIAMQSAQQPIIHGWSIDVHRLSDILILTIDTRDLWRCWDSGEELSPKGSLNWMFVIRISPSSLTVKISKTNTL